ncbi:hypothetical protein [Yersinia phage fHe-Yen9-04]|uniref:Uncharacterized protein n=1 Tax=Yersinia phage fHe-Yen9-04 TaxID=2052742 RepID=A0A2C9CZE7_9CAUD|nr:hypothetical protein FDJ41_gp115 [Yersinia phage fHe-Yen9-04]SOK58392.1 hypothetical protein [Yersinia phage fHe-Yen9-04]VUE36161.1 hypothetical protein [Yersinia phage fHe-Yen9-04]
MNSDELLLARKLLNNLTIENRNFIVTRDLSRDIPSYEDCRYPSHLISWLHLNNLLVLLSSYPIDDDERYFIEIFKITDLGSTITWFTELLEQYNKGMDGEHEFRYTGKLLYTILHNFNELEVDPVIQLITDEEKEAYQHFYRTQVWDSTVKETKTYTREEALQTIEFNKGLLSMFEMSVLLGARGTDPTRTNNYVFKKCMEELGEMAVEDQIENGLSYKDAGSDGVAGEAVDLAICAMDMFALQYGHLNPEEIQEKFIIYMNKKLNKWKNTLGK